MSHISSPLRRLFGGSRSQPSDADAPPRQIDEAGFRLLVESCPDAVCRVGQDLRIRDFSADALRLFGRDPAAMLGSSLSVFLVPEDRRLAAAAIAEAFRGSGKLPPASLRVQRPGGSTLWIEMAAQPLRGPAGELPDDAVLVMRDIPEHSGLERRLAPSTITDEPSRHRFSEALLTLTDTVTGLANRDAFDDALDLEWRRARRDRTRLSLLVLGLDGYKAFDDPFGRRLEDAALRAVAATINTARRRPGDFVARFRGDDLAFLLPNTPAGGAARVAETIRTNVAALGLPNTGSILGGGRITASLGAVTAGSRRCDATIGPAALVAAASAALDHAKSLGCSRLVAAQLISPDLNSEFPEEAGMDTRP